MFDDKTMKTLISQTLTLANCHSDDEMILEIRKKLEEVIAMYPHAIEEVFDYGVREGEEIFIETHKCNHDDCLDCDRLAQSFHAYWPTIAKAYLALEGEQTPHSIVKFFHDAMVQAWEDKKIDG